MGKYIELNNELINIESLSVAYVDEDSIILKFSDRPNMELDYSEVKNDVNDEKEIDKDYRKLRTFLIIDKYKELNENSQSIEIFITDFYKYKTLVGSINKIVSRGTMSTFKKIKMIKLLMNSI